MLNLNYCHPCIEQSGSELCFISHPKHERRVSCDPSGTIRMQQTWNGWEVFRFTQVEKSGNFIISSWTQHDHKVLCSDSNGKVYTDDKKNLVEKNELSSAEWKITIHPEKHGLHIKSVPHGRYLGFSFDELYTSNNNFIEETAWHLEPAHRNHFFISSKCFDKKRLSCTKENDVTTRSNQGGWEKWVIEPTNRELGQFTIRSFEHEKYLGYSSFSDGKLIVTEAKHHHWKIIPSPNEEGGIVLESVEYARNLSCNSKGEPTAHKGTGAAETWVLEPIMPDTRSEKNIWILAGIGLATAATAVAAPYAVMGAVGALGFGASGIVGGSIGAGMMSAEAIAAGGGVAAGGAVATLQSIGAAGLGLYGTSAAVTAGAVIGGLTSSGVAKVSGGLKNEQEQIGLENAGSHLPLCAWRMWRTLIQSQ